MEYSQKQYVYHGSNKEFDSSFAKPKRQIRSRENAQGFTEVIFDEESFHATPHKWIALAYTHTEKTLEIDGVEITYNIGTDLYKNTNEVIVLGAHSLEKSLEILYGNGGYVYYFDKVDFIHKQGLGNLEVIIQKPIKPISIEKINNPVEEMKKLGVKFIFIDLTLPKNKKAGGY